MTTKKRISLLNLSLPAVPPVQDDENFVEFNRLYNALKILADRLDAMQPSVIAKASEAISFGKFVNFYNVDGELTAQLADALTSKPAHAYCLTKDLEAGDSAEFLCMGLHPGFASLVPGTRYFLGTGGLVTPTPPSTGIKQALGVAIGESSMWVQCVIDYLGS